MTSPVDELRTAATKLRTLAEAATPGPWQHTGSGPGHEYKGCGTVYTTSDDLFGGEIAAPAGDCYPRGGYSPAEDMAWIAAVHPGVGLALADLLESIADDIGDADTFEDGDGRVCVRPEGWPYPAWTAAVAVARLILGGDS